MSTYNYRSLPPGCIRLLRISPHENDNAPIHCQLFEYSLASARRKGTHLYEALSYCWGSPTKSQTAFVGESLLYITENLHAALLRLRDPALERIIWIDAICINQDDLDEKGQQVQLMAEIYARASCVIVWLENVTGDDLIDRELQAGGRQAIRALEVAATRSMGLQAQERKDRGSWYSVRPLTRAPKDPFDEQDRLAVEKLLERSWFHRVWVLQEVAAARHVLILCQFAEIDGQAFCSGLSQMSRSLLLTDQDTRSRIRSTVNLIRGATLRPKGVVNASGQFSLQISSLGYLIEIHYTREATDHRDKIYALLGMSTDKPTGLVPNYELSWKDLFLQLAKSLLPKSLSVTMINENETALIRNQGYVVGTVRRVTHEDTWDGEQIVSFTPHGFEFNIFRAVRNRTLEWPLEATSKSIRQGDIVCLLQGAPLPTIVRAHQDYCSIVAIAVDKNMDMFPNTDYWHANLQFEFLLAWSWKPETHQSNLNNFLTARGLSPRSCVALQIPNDLNTAVMLLETGQYYQALLKLHSIKVVSEDVGKSQHDAVAIAEIVQNMRNRHKDFDMVGDMIGRKKGHVEMTEDFLIQLASTSKWEPMAFVHETQGESVHITENILTAAAENKSHGKRIMSVLLSGRENQVSSIEKCLKAAIANMYDGIDIIGLLLNNKMARISITESILIALAGSCQDDQRINYRKAQLFLNRRGDQITITENVLMAAVANECGQLENGIIGLLLEREGDQITITENVLAAAAANERNGYTNISLLLQWKESHVTITVKVLEAAATNKKLRGSILTYLFVRERISTESDGPMITNRALKTAYQNLSDSEGRAALHL